MTQTPRTTKPRTKKTAVPLVIEQHPDDYTGLPFITLIQYRKQMLLTIVDNVDESAIRAFVLDLCGPEGVNEELVIVAAMDWFLYSRHEYPISIEFARRGLTNQVTKVYRSLDVGFVSRVIGPAPKFPMAQVKSPKRRRRKPLPASIEVRRKVVPIRRDEP